MTTRFTSIAWVQVTMIRRLRSILQNCLTVIAAIVFCEVGLQVAARFSEPVDSATLPPVSRTLAEAAEIAIGCGVYRRHRDLQSGP